MPITRPQKHYTNDELQECVKECNEIVCLLDRRRGSWIFYHRMKT
jgi:hypothetical protein